MQAKIENEMWTGKIFFGRFVMTSNLSVWQWWIYNREYTKAGHKLYLELCFEDWKARQRVMNFCVHCYVKENTTLSCFEVPTATPPLMLAGTRWDGMPYQVTLGQPKIWQPFAVGSLVLTILILTQWINALRRLLLTSTAKTLPFNFPCERGFSFRARAPKRVFRRHSCFDAILMYPDVHFLIRGVSRERSKKNLHIKATPKSFLKGKKMYVNRGDRCRADGHSCLLDMFFGTLKWRL